MQMFMVTILISILKSSVMAGISQFSHPAKVAIPTSSLTTVCGLRLVGKDIKSF